MMNKSDSLQSAMKRWLLKGFTVREVAECLISFDAPHPSDIILGQMKQNDFDQVGVRIDGFTVGYVLRKDLSDCKQIGDRIRYFGSNQLIHSSRPLRDAIGMLNDQEAIYVKMLGSVHGIITRYDLQKPPVRMWLFGLITVLEEAYTALVYKHYPNNSWIDQLTISRIDRAKALQKERQRRKHKCDLLQCLYFADKAKILIKNDQLRKELGFASSTRAKEAIKMLEQLRNSLAHADDIISINWQAIVRLADRVEDVLKLYQL